jgi:hypothetical protein
MRRLSPPKPEHPSAATPAAMQPPEQREERAQAGRRVAERARPTSRDNGLVTIQRTAEKQTHAGL